MKYYEVHVKCGSNGFSTFFAHEFPTTPNSDDIASHAVNKGLMEDGDLQYVDYTAIISKKEYEEATR